LYILSCFTIYHHHFKGVQMKNVILITITLVCGAFVTQSVHSQTWETVGTAGFSIGAVGGSTSLAFSPTGEPYVAYSDGGDGGKATVSKFNGTTWVRVGGAGISTGGCFNPALAFNSSGEPYIFIDDFDLERKSTVMKFNGTTWETVGQAGFSASAAWWPSIAFSSNDQPYVAYQDGAPSGGVTVMKFDGSSWVVVGTTEFSAGSAVTPSLAFSGTDQPYVAYRDNSNGNRVTVMRFNGTMWETVGAAGFSNGSAYTPSLAFSDGGVPYVAYQDCSVGSKASVMKFNGTAWETVGAAGFSAGEAYYTSLAFSNTGELHVAYEDVAYGWRVTVKKYDGTAWLTVGTEGFSATGGAEFTSLAFSNTNQPYVSYKDWGNGTRVTVMRYPQVAPPSVDAGADELITLGYGDPYRTLSATVTGGTSPYSYLWSTNESTQSITVCPIAPTQYTVTVTDANNQTATDDVFVDVLDWRCGNNLDKVKLCHNGHTICVAPAAVQAHLDHGDYLGACQASKESRATPDQFGLSQNYPNPFNPTTQIEFSVPLRGEVLLTVSDLYGREVDRLVDGEVDASVHQVVFDASQHPSGVYVYRLSWNGLEAFRMMTLLK
jgi:hypothetical protein